jgi:PPOX class probable F420-dependent enzyme
MPNLRSSITMTDEEVAAFLTENRTITMATVGPDGHPHLTAMWYGLVEGGKVGFETKAKGQKVANLRRNSLITVMAEDGITYDELRGVSIEGTAEIVEGDRLWGIGVSVFERYVGPYDESLRGGVESMLNKRVGVIVHATRVRTWDHRKMNLAPMALGGSTAPTSR